MRIRLLALCILDDKVFYYNMCDDNISYDCTMCGDGNMSEYGNLSDVNMCDDVNISDDGNISDGNMFGDGRRPVRGGGVV